VHKWTFFIFKFCSFCNKNIKRILFRWLTDTKPSFSCNCFDSFLPVVWSSGLVAFGDVMMLRTRCIALCFTHTHVILSVNVMFRFVSPWEPSFHIPRENIFLLPYPYQRQTRSYKNFCGTILASNNTCCWWKRGKPQLQRFSFLITIYRPRIFYSGYYSPFIINKNKHIYFPFFLFSMCI